MATSFADSAILMDDRAVELDSDGIYNIILIHSTKEKQSLRKSAVLQRFPSHKSPSKVLDVKSYWGGATGRRWAEEESDGRWICR